MIFACGISNYSIGIFHLVNHAFFKALLFLSAGAVIHALNDEQSLSKMGGLAELLPFTYVSMLIGSFSLMALPYLTGFYSKDLILEAAYGQYLVTGSVAYWLGTIAAVSTACYSIRSLALAFFGPPNGAKINYESAHEPPFSMAIPLFILAIMSIFFGYLTADLFVGLGTQFWGNSLFVHPSHLSMVEAHFGVSLLYKLLPVLGGSLGALIAALLYGIFPNFLINLKLTRMGRDLYRFLNQKYWFDLLYSRFILTPALNFGYITNKVLDRGAIELIGPYGLVNNFRSASQSLIKFDTGFIPNYALYIFLGAVGFIVLIFYVEDPRWLILYLWTLVLLPNQKKLI